MISFGVDIATGSVLSGIRRVYNMGAMGGLKVQLEPTIKFKIEYPLTNPKSIALTHEDGTGWTKQQFADAVRAEYKKVYEEEEAAAGNPRNIPGMLNRARSAGPHGIWGHDIGDLVLEGIEKLADGSWALCMGS